MDPADCERHNRHLKAKFDRIRKDEVAWEELYTEDAEVVLAAFGVVARYVARLWSVPVKKESRQGLSVLLPFGHSRTELLGRG